MEIDGFGLHEQALKFRARRNQVLSSNIANSDTPNYKARDFDFKAVLRQEMQAPVRLAATQDRHLRHDQGVVASTQMAYRIPQQASLDGNTVETDREQTEFSANVMRYEASLRFLDGRIKGLLTAIKGHSS